MPLPVSCQRSKPIGTNSPAPERPETPPNPSAIVPFGRDTDFIERGAILDQIHYKCAVPGSRIALVGLGGVGWVRTPSQIWTADCGEASRSLPSNTRTGFKSDRLRRGSSGLTRAMRHGLSRATGPLQTTLRSRSDGTQRRTYFSSCTIGCATKERGNGSLYLIISTMRASFSRLEVPKAGTRSHSCRIFHNLGMAPFL